MNQSGFIVEIVDEVTAKVQMQKHSACANCGKCATVSSESKEIFVEVDNTYGAKVGDHVEVNMENINVIKATAIVYVLPLIALLVGTIGTFYGLNALGFAGNVEIVSAVVGLTLTLASYLWMRANDNKFKDSRNYIPIVTRILIDL
ncbi:SoxR reducing system RseC family protein [Metaclostridioides mangenotii]|uniref:SoxR reducing system RseC family protein n=1 Tax=Metaclostridioides mangenotii TaxID=1540 RepID=UPI0004846A95|nr:SoxR reducing system RseC family protein [Clostridioides mangenotii]